MTSAISGRVHDVSEKYSIFPLYIGQRHFLAHCFCDDPADKEFLRIAGGGKRLHGSIVPKLTSQSNAGVYGDGYRNSELWARLVNRDTQQPQDFACIRPVHDARAKFVVEGHLAVFKRIGEVDIRG